jgi:hypothetical protein
MAKIIELGPYESPPEDESWVLVTPGKRGAPATGVSRSGRSKRQTFSVPYDGSESDLERALSEAIAWAERHDISKVYMTSEDEG